MYSNRPGDTVKADNRVYLSVKLVKRLLLASGADVNLAGCLGISVRRINYTTSREQGRRQFCGVTEVR